MKAVIQRVSQASVEIEGKSVAKINTGLMILVGVELNDTIDDVNWLAAKISNLRIFSDAEGLMNCSLKETGGDALVVSQFTLHANTKKGNRPSFVRAAKPELAIPLYEAFIKEVEKEIQKPVACGVFGADMKVQLVNDGPVTICIDTKNKE